MENGNNGQNEVQEKTRMLINIREVVLNPILNIFSFWGSVMSPISSYILEQMKWGSIFIWNCGVFHENVGRRWLRQAAYYRQLLFMGNY